MVDLLFPIYVQTYKRISAKLCFRFCKVVTVKRLIIVFVSGTVDKIMSPNLLKNVKLNNWRPRCYGFHFNK